LAELDLGTDAGLRDYALLLVGLSTGRRVAELAGMRREHLTIRKRTVEIEWPRCKGGKRLHDELPRGGARGEAADALVSWIARLERLAPRVGQPPPRTSRPRQAAMPDSTAHADTDTDTDTDTGGAAGDGTERGTDFAQAVATRRPSSLGAPDRVGRFDQPIWISLARNNTAGHPLTARAIAQLCEKRLGVSKVHALRHTFARALEDVGAKVSEIQAALGHADLGTTGRYLARLRHGENRHLARLSALYGLGGLDQRLDSDVDRAGAASAGPTTARPTTG